MGRACRCEFQCELESEPDFGGSSAGRNPKISYRLMLAWHRPEADDKVLAQGFAGEKDGRNAQAAVMNLGGEEVVLLCPTWAG